MSGVRPARRPAATLLLLRRALLGIFVLGAAGTGVELVLLGHTEDVWQWIPVGLLGASLLLLAAYAFAPGRAGIRAFQGLMLLFLGAGVLGAVLHYQGNAEFEREMVPAVAGWDLFREAMTGATPGLAPGTMLWLGLVGLAWAFRHPRLAESDNPEPSPAE